MKPAQCSKMIIGFSFIITFMSTASASVYDSYRLEMEKACPIVWEDLGTAISESVPVGDVWQGDATDRSEFVGFYATENQVTAADAEVIADSTESVAVECASYRLALLDEIQSKVPVDITTALTAAGGSANANYLDGAWLVGDVRVTGRATPAQGWVFLAGQTVGNGSSGATLAGDQYEALFDLAKSWSGNSSSAVFANGATVSLPDMRGRSLYGADNMGGSSANRITAAAADTLGGAFGTEKVTLSKSQMPSHTHGMNTKGDHGHTMGYDGIHDHKLRSSIYTGSSSGRSDWGYFEGKARPNYQNTIKDTAVVDDGNHKHPLGNNGNHQHTIYSEGGSAAVTTISPGVVFNIEMKFQN